MHTSKKLFNFTCYSMSSYFIRVLLSSFICRYYENGATAVLPDFFSVSVLDKFIIEAMSAQGLLSEYQPDIELWLGETSSCYGGAPVLSNAYVAGFMYVH